MWFIGVEVEQETSAPPPKKNPGSAPGYKDFCKTARALMTKLNQGFSIQLFRERLSEKVHATIPKGIVGGF